MFGRDPEIPSSLQKSPRLSYNYEDYVEIVKENFRKMYEITRENLQGSKEKSKEAYDIGKGPKNYRIGDKVLLKYEGSRVGRSSKFAPRYVGPYEVLEKIDDTSYRIKKGRNSCVVHGNKLKYIEEN
jgi:ribosomal protein L21E